MTTICWDGNILASDSRVVCNSEIVSDNYRKIYLFDSDIIYMDDPLLAIGMSGFVGHFDKVIQMIVNNTLGKLDTEYKSDISAIVVGMRYVYTLAEEETYMTRYDKNTKISVGSGDIVARTAMHLKRNAIQAIRIAKQLDCKTGGPVQSVRLG